MTILKYPCDDRGERRRKAVRDYFHENKARLELEKAEKQLERYFISNYLYGEANLELDAYKNHIDTCFILSDRLKEKPR